jgi:hypothetical protein
VTATSGTFSAKIQRQEPWSTIPPPASGPTITAIDPHAVHEPIAAPRSFGGKAATMIASELGVSSAPATPCKARAAMRRPMPGARAQATEKTPNAPTPIANTRRSP